MSILCCGCKLNLGLKITGHLADGRHELDSVFFPLAFPRDILTLEEASQGTFALACEPEFVEPEKNILHKAWRLFSEASGQNIGVRGHLVKKIPMGAGLGGGSSDAANFLRWLNARALKPLSEDALATLAVKIGADVPFFLQNYPCQAKGVGEILTPLEQKRNFYLVIIWPEIHVDTAWAFKSYDQLGYPENILTNKKRADTEIFFKSGAAMPVNLGNDLERVVFAMWPELADLREMLLGLGAADAAMSGSGSSMYGIFFEKDLATRALGVLKRNYSHVYYTQALVP